MTAVLGVVGKLTPGASADGFNFGRAGGAAELAPPGITGGVEFPILAFVLTLGGLG